MLANLKLMANEGLFESRRFTDHWKVTNLSAADAGNAFQASLPKHFQDALLFVGMNKATLEEKIENLKAWRTRLQQQVQFGNRVSKLVVFDTIAPQIQMQNTGKMKFQGKCRRCYKYCHKVKDCTAPYAQYNREQ